jgi:hypothetical protein
VAEHALKHDAGRQERDQPAAPPGYHETQTDGDRIGAAAAE